MEVNILINKILKEMEWNGPTISITNHSDLCYESDGPKSQTSTVLKYECIPGSSVKHELRKALKKIGVKPLQIQRGSERYRRSFSHDYYIEVEL